MLTRGKGLMRKRFDARDFLYTPPTVWDGVTLVDLSGLFPQGPYDQLKLGSCVSQGTSACADFARAKAGLPPLDPPSRLFVYYEGRRLAGYPLDQDTGLQIRDGFAALAGSGAPPESDWPYVVEEFATTPSDQAYADAPHDEALVYGSVTANQIDDAIASGYPVAYGFEVYDSF